MTFDKNQQSGKQIEVEAGSANNDFSDKFSCTPKENQGRAWQ